MTPQDAETQDSIRASGLRVHRSGTPALRSVSFSAGAGVTVLLGPNGAGKTTLIEALLGNLRRSGGELSVLGRDPGERTRHNASRVGWLPQDQRLVSGLTSLDLVTYAAWLKGLPWAAGVRSAHRALELVDLTPMARRRVGTLSGGQQRRLAFASAVAHRPAVLLLDEPMNGLDPEQRRHLRDVIRAYAEDHCVVVATHILQDVPVLSGNVLILDRGEVIFDAEADDLIARAATPTMGGLEDVYLRLLRRSQNT